MLSRLLARAFSLCAALALILGLSVPTVQAQSASGSAVPAEAPAGTRFTFFFSGYTPGERVDPWVTRPDSRTLPRYPTVEADADGAVVWTYDVPPEGPAGTWTAAARGIRSNVTIAATFVVTSADTSAPPSSVNPQRAPAGTTFTFQAAGFTPEERIGAWLVQPNGNSRELSDEVFWQFADVNGNFTWFWNSPADAPAGGWVAVAQGTDSGYRVQLPFEVTPGDVTAPVRSISPESGPPGTTFSITIGGLQPNEEVGTWLNQPNGARVDSGTPYLKADLNGVANWSWTAPADAPAGNWQAVTRGIESGSEVVLNFTVGGANLPPEEQQARGSVTPQSGPRGTTFTFQVAGFVPGETIAYWVTDADRNPQRERTTVVADQAGYAGWTYTVPDDPNVKPGDWSMSALGEDSRRQVVMPFVVSGPEDPAPTSVTPNSGNPGDTLSFFAGAFPPKDEIGNWVNGPNGLVLDGTPEVVANEDGEARWDWTIPEDAPAGNYEMLAQDEDAVVVYRIPFSVARDTPPPTRSTTVTPEAGPPGTVFTFSADGYLPGERVGYWFDRPDGSVLIIDQELTADADGRITLVWQSPEDAARGNWRFVGRSSQSDEVNNDVTTVLPFAIR
ncbi:MAG: hypothetical protein HC822_06450 [Oscillochloris sp.]|nr:hypothetical protein [Oscillochloris sp.]